MARKGRGETIKISDLFAVYKNKLIAPEKTVLVTFQEIVEDMLKMQIPIEKCSYTPSTKTLTVAVSGPFKTEILLRKKEILTHLQGRLGVKNAPKEIL
jgi:hypothetical protein